MRRDPAPGFRASPAVTGGRHVSVRFRAGRRHTDIDVDLVGAVMVAHVSEHGTNPTTTSGGPDPTDHAPGQLPGPD